jgi:hypothetical protein
MTSLGYVFLQLRNWLGEPRGAEVASQAAPMHHKRRRLVRAHVRAAYQELELSSPNNHDVQPVTVLAAP